MEQKWRTECSRGELCTALHVWQYTACPCCKHEGRYSLCSANADSGSYSARWQWQNQLHRNQTRTQIESKWEQSMETHMCHRFKHRSTFYIRDTQNKKINNKSDQISAEKEMETDRETSMFQSSAFTHWGSWNHGFTVKWTELCTVSLFKSQCLFTKKKKIIHKNESHMCEQCSETVFAQLKRCSLRCICAYVHLHSNQGNKSLPTFKPYGCYFYFYS